MKWVAAILTASVVLPVLFIFLILQPAEELEVCATYAVASESEHELTDTQRTNAQNIVDAAPQGLNPVEAGVLLVAAATVTELLESTG